MLMGVGVWKLCGMFSAQFCSLCVSVCARPCVWVVFWLLYTPKGRRIQWHWFTSCVEGEQNAEEIIFQHFLLTSQHSTRFIASFYIFCLLFSSYADWKRVHMQYMNTHTHHNINLISMKCNSILRPSILTSAPWSFAVCLMIRLLKIM